MALTTMYRVGNSRITQLTDTITAAAQVIPVGNVAFFPAAPNLATIGTDDDAEVVFYAGIDTGAGTLTGCLRGRSLTSSRAWPAGTDVYHAWTAETANAIMDNVNTLNEDKADSGVTSQLRLDVDAASQTAAAATTRAELGISNAAIAFTAAGLAHDAADVAQTTANAAIPSAQKGAANGVAPLDASQKVPAANLPPMDMTITPSTTTNFNGLVKGNGANMAQAVAGTDYAPAPRSYTATLTAAGWSASAPYTQTVTVTGITANDAPIVDVTLSATAATAINERNAWGNVDKIVTAANQITVTCLETKPTVALNLRLRVV